MVRFANPPHCCNGSELRRIDKVDYRFYKDNEKEKCMEMVEEVRRQSVYPHGTDICTDECKKRGN